jgi:hypothetical protein
MLESYTDLNLWRRLARHNPSRKQSRKPPPTFETAECQNGFQAGEQPFAAASYSGMAHWPGANFQWEIQQ